MSFTEIWNSFSKDFRNRLKNGGRLFYSSMGPYLPTVGVIGHSVYALHLTLDQGLPKLIPNCGSKVLNTALLSSQFGLAYYFHQKEPLKSFNETNPSARISHLIYSAYLSVLFNFGTFLLIIVLKNLLPKSDLVRLSVCSVLLYASFDMGISILKSINGNH